MWKDMFVVNSILLSEFSTPRPRGLITKREWEVHGICWYPLDGFMMFVVGKSIRVCWCYGFDTSFENERD